LKRWHKTPTEQGCKGPPDIGECFEESLTFDHLKRGKTQKKDRRGGNMPIWSQGGGDKKSLQEKKGNKSAELLCQKGKKTKEGKYWGGRHLKKICIKKINKGRFVRRKQNCLYLVRNSVAKASRKGKPGEWKRGPGETWVVQSRSSGRR